LIQNPEGFGGFEELGFGGGGQKLVERRVAGGFPTQFLPPFFEVGKIHIGGEVEAAGGLVDFVAGESLVVGIAA
jgi:hypothetical protein